MSDMRAKFVIDDVIKHSSNLEELSFHAVYKSDGYPEGGHDEDNTYALYTPSAQLEISITNPVLVGKFKVGDIFYVDFTKVEK